jgi:sensor histidine kinase YesM
MHIYSYVYIYICLYIHIPYIDMAGPSGLTTEDYIYTYLHAYVYIYLYAYINNYVQICIFIYLSIYMIYIYEYIYVYRYGQGTRDMAGPSGLTTEDFVNKVAWRLGRYVAAQVSFVLKYFVLCI